VIRNLEFEVTKADAFSSLPAGRVKIVDLNKNPGYQKYYAPGEKHHNIFNSVMIHLFKVAGFEFEGAPYHLDLKSEVVLNQLQPHTLYLEHTDAGLTYVVLGLDNIIKSRIIPWSALPQGFPRNAYDIVTGNDQYLTDILKLTAAAGHTLNNDNNLHDMMVFTKESSEKLKNFWLDCKQYQFNMRPSVHTNNSSMLFSASTNQPNNNRENDSMAIKNNSSYNSQLQCIR
jgi:hypothetical protein